MIDRRNSLQLRRGRPVWASLFVGACFLAVVAPAPLAAQVTADNLAAITDSLESTASDDLVRLTTSYADAAAELQIATLTLNTLASLPPGAAFTNLDMKIARINVDTAQQKTAIIRRVVERELSAAQSNVAILEQIEKALRGADSAPVAQQTNLRLARARETVEILKMILAVKTAS